MDSDDEYVPLLLGDVDRDILKRQNRSLGLDVNYVPSWTPIHGLREFYQNWKDAIKVTSRLYREDVTIIDKGFNSKDVYTIEARHPDNSDLLGYISWKAGTLELTNFKASLSPKTLRLGVTSKRDNDVLAGTHGEGYKIGALVMRREGYNVRFEANSYIQNFYFPQNTPEELYCNMNPMGVKKLDKLREAFALKARQGLQRELKANPWEDVCLTIGKFRDKGKKVTKENFLNWIKVTLDLDPPSKMLHTRDGDLILDDRFSNKIYVKSLRMDEPSASLPFKYGYNFSHVEVNRDRERISDPKEEARMLCRIWTDAIQTDVEDTLPRLVDTLQSDILYADVNRMEENLSLLTATKIWQHLLGQDPSVQPFYYNVEEHAMEVELIEKSLKRKPVPLKRAMWLSLRRHQLLRTAEEERQHRLQNAPISKIQPTLYSEGLQRVLKCALALASSTVSLELEFRSGNATDLDMLLDGPKLLINDKWLDFDKSHEDAPCSLSFAAMGGIEINQFSCTHILTELYELILMEISKHPGEPNEEFTKTHPALRRKVAEKLHQMPCMLEVSAPAETFDQLDVTWVHPESSKMSKLYGLEWKGRVTLHRESTCLEKKRALLADDLSESSKDVKEHGKAKDSCSCAEKIVSLKHSHVVFDGLDHTQKYFPMVSRIEHHAFYAFPPNSVRPNPSPAIKDSKVVSSKASRNKISRRVLSMALNSPQRHSTLSRAKGVIKKEEFANDHYQNDLYDADDHDETGIAMNTTQPRILSGHSSTRDPVHVNSSVRSTHPAGKEAHILEDQIATLSANLQTKEDELSALQGNMYKQQEELNTIITTLDKDLSLKEKEVGDVRRLYAAEQGVKSIASEQGSKISELSAQVQQLRAEIKELTQENEELKLDIETATQQASTAFGLASRATARGRASGEPTTRSSIKRKWEDVRRMQQSERNWPRLLQWVSSRYSRSRTNDFEDNECGWPHFHERKIGHFLQNANG